MTEQGHIAKIKGKRAYVALKKRPECNSCKACVFGKNQSIIVPAVANIDCKVGDNVLVEMPQKSILFAPIFLYLLPLLFMLLGALIGAKISEALQILLAFAFLLASFCGVWLLDKLYFRKKPKYIATITAKQDNQAQ